MILKNIWLASFHGIIICQAHYHNIAVICQNSSNWEIRLNLAIMLTEIASSTARFIWF
jgi:hypothetical protein